MAQFEKKSQSQHSLELLEPKKYNVYLMNDNYTSMEFVVNILMSIFHKSEPEAVDITMRVHNDGKGLCGTYPYDIAETKVDQVHKNAKSNNYPLKAELEEA